MRRHRRGVLVVAAVAIAATVSACSSSAQHGAPAELQQARPTPQLAAATAASRSFAFQGMGFRLTGQTQYETNLPQCPKPQPVMRIPAGIAATVDVVPDHTANCPAQPWVSPVVPQYPYGYLGDVSLLSGYDSQSFYVQLAEPYAQPVPTLPKGSFEAKMPASAATFTFTPGLTTPVFLFWDSATDALLLVTGPHSVTLAQEVRSALHEV